MSRTRAMLSVAVIVALLVAIWAATAGDDNSPTTPATPAPISPTATPTTEVPAPPAPTTTARTTATFPTSTTVPVETTTDPEARVEEVRLILQDLYFRWFDAIYRNDEEAVLDVVATTTYLEAFHNAVGSLDLPSQPEIAQIRPVEVEILRDDQTCLVTYSRIDLSAWRGAGVEVVGVNVLLPKEGTWRLGTAWSRPRDLWESDCLIEPDL